MSEITINKSEFENLEDCAVGEPLDLTGTVTKIKGDDLLVTIESVDYGETEETEPVKSKVNPVARIRRVERGNY